eukprot:TRINITY_DN9539_c0_g1_i28.p1 TRINITY_DN9539_c0_g1~~TRINITY_DN9539_c0_g1_i28.p1  ORF type:complete len:998 (+),score=377.34 TRINITY_DN9539_c0_g1_i28:154-2994(+)
MESAMQAFELHTPAIDLKSNIDCMFIKNNLLYYTDSKRVLHLLQYEILNNQLKLADLKAEQMNSKVDSIESFDEERLLVLSGGKLGLVNARTLRVEAVGVKGSITKMKVGPNRVVAIARGKELQILAYDKDRNTFTSMFGKGDKRLIQSEEILGMVWCEDLLGIVHKKAYLTYDLKANGFKEFSQPKNTLYPRIMTFTDLWVVTSGDFVMEYTKTGKLMLNSEIPVESSSKANPVLAMHVRKKFLIVVYEFEIRIFNLNNPKEMQRVKIGQKLSYKGWGMDKENVLLGVGMQKGPKKSLVSGFLILHEIPIEMQMKHLLLQCKISSAQDLLLQDTQGMPAKEFAVKKEQFNVNAAWSLLAHLNFAEAVKYFSKSNFDPRELLLLIPEAVSEEFVSGHPKDHLNQLLTTLDSLVNKKPGDQETKMEEGVNAIIGLLEGKRKVLSKNCEDKKDEKNEKEALKFTWATFPLNEHFKNKPSTPDVVLRIIDSGLLKLYVMYRKFEKLKEIIESDQNFKCNFEEMDEFLKKYLNKDGEMYTAEICQIFVYTKSGRIAESLAICKQLLQQNKPKLKPLLIKTLRHILVEKVEDKKLIQDYGRYLIIRDAEEGMKVFIENERLGRIMTADEVLSFLKANGKYQPEAKRIYLEHLVKKPNTEERFFTSLGLLHIDKIKEVMKRGSGSDPLTLKYRGVFKDFLKRHRTYSAQALLDAIKDFDLFDEEIFLHSVQGMHDKALTKLVERGKTGGDFSLAEEYCLEQSESLLALLLEKILGVYTEYRNKYIIMLNDKSVTENKQSELESLKKFMNSYESYCKIFLRRYAGNEKMDASKVISVLPDEWCIREQKDEGEDAGLLKYLVLTLSDRVNKYVNYKIAKNAAEMERLNLQADKAELQKPFIVMSSKSLCKVCDKPLGSKSFCVFPNGVVTHTQCSKDNTICPIDNINFAKKIYE